MPRAEAQARQPTATIIQSLHDMLDVCWYSKPFLGMSVPMVFEPGALQPRLHGDAVCAIRTRRRRDSSPVAGMLCRRESQHVNQGVDDQ